MAVREFSVVVNGVRWVLDQAANKVAVQVPLEEWRQVVARLHRLKEIWRRRPADEVDDPEWVVREVEVPAAHVFRITDEEGGCDYVQLGAREWDSVVEYLEDLDDILAIEEPRSDGVPIEDVKALLARERTWRTG